MGRVKITPSTGIIDFPIAKTSQANFDIYLAGEIFEMSFESPPLRRANRLIGPKSYPLPADFHGALLTIVGPPAHD